MLTTMDAVQDSDVHSLEDDDADQTMHTLLEENKESSFIENAEVLDRMFEYLPGFVDEAQNIFSENSGMDMLIYPQKDKLSHSSLAEVAAKHGQSEPSPKFDDLEMCHDDLLIVEENTEKMFAGIALEAMPPHEEFTMKTTSETLETILVPSKCQNEHSTQKTDKWSVEAGVFQYANNQETLFQGTGQLKLSAISENLQPPTDKTDELESANCDTCLQKPVLKAHLQHEESTNKHLQGEHCLHLVRDNIASKQHSEEHEMVERFSTLEAVNEPDVVIPLQNQENTNMYLEGEQCINMSKTIIFLKQRAKKHEHDEKCLLLGAACKPDPVVIQANREEDSKHVNRTLHVSMEGDVKTDKHEESPEKQLEREEQFVSFCSSDNASRQHSYQYINDGKLSILKALNKPDGGVEKEDLRDGEKPYADTVQPLSIVSEGSAEVVPKTYNNSNEFNIGDLVWAKVKSHPWWPAKVFDLAHASEAAKKLEQPGRVLIAFFGDCTFAWLQKSQLIAFHPNFENKVKQTDSKTFCKGVAEALEEFCKLSELGLICQHYKGSLHSLSISSNGQSGSGNVVNAKHCKLTLENAERIKPTKTLEFIKSMACNPFGSCKPTLEAAEQRGHAYGFRACMVSLSTTDLFQSMQTAETLSVHHSQQKRKSSHVDLYMEAGAEAKEVKKKVKTSGVTKMERQEDGTETLLALACYHPKLLKRLEKSRLRKDLQCSPARTMGCRQTLGQVNDLKLIFGSKSSSKANIKTTINVRCKRRKTSEALDAFSFTTSESEENLSDSDIKVSKRRKKSSNVEVPKLTRSVQSEAKKQFNLLSSERLDGSNSSDVEKPREVKTSNPENKSSKLSRLGYRIRKVAIELAGKTPPGNCVDKTSNNTSKFRSKKEVIDSTAKTRSSSKHDKAMFQGSALDECHFSTVQLHQSLKLLARDPLNKADMTRSPHATPILLRFRAEVVKTKDIARVLFDDVEEDAAVSLDNAQVGFKDTLKDDQLSKALDTSAFKTCNELPNEHSTDSFQAARKGKSKITERTMAKSSRKFSASICRKRLYSTAPEVREPIEARPFENNKEPFLGGTAPAASNTGSFSQRDYKKSCAPLQLGIFMQFPQNFTLPSETQLKALFVQFGPVQPSGVTVFKDLASAQVVFTHGEDAKAAYKHVKRTAMFGHASVIYKLCHFSSPVNRKETRTFFRGSSSRAHEKVPSHKNEHMATCSKLAISLKERVNGHLRAVSERTKNGREGRSDSMQHSRPGKIPSNRRRFDPLGDILQERMMTLIRRVSVIVGTPNTK